MRYTYIQVHTYDIISIQNAVQYAALAFKKKQPRHQKNELSHVNYAEIKQDTNKSQRAVS